MGCEPSKRDPPGPNLIVVGKSELKPPIKILILGDASVGKTALLIRLTEHKFLPQPVLGVQDNREFVINTQGRDITLQIWDTGTAFACSGTDPNSRGAHGVIVAFDLNKRESFTNLSRWCSEVDRYGSAQIVKMIVGTKRDLKRVTEFDEADRWAATKDMEYLETSSKEDYQVIAAFESIANTILDRGLV